MDGGGEAAHESGRVYYARVAVARALRVESIQFSPVERLAIGLQIAQV